MEKIIEKFLPTSLTEVKQRGWDQLDIILVTGDAYVDHPSFGIAIIGKILESRGYRVGIIAMLDWRNPDCMKVLGKPRLFFGVTSGNVDSMISNFTAFKMRRSDNPYVPGGIAGHLPNRALIVYCNLIKQVYRDVPIVIGGIEASMRRVVHYDFWSDKVRRSILEDTRADILVYGMGEKQVVEIAERIERGKSLQGIPGTVISAKEKPEQAIELPAEETAIASKEKFIKFYRSFYRNQRKVLAIPAGGRFILHYPPPEMTQPELDEIYGLPFIRKPHPIYRKTIPAFQMIKDSVTAHRGCVSGCSFCSLTLHQGKKIVSRSQQSILQEVERIAWQPDFKGNISDIGGPSANNYGFDCKINWQCNRESCTFPELCPNLQMNTGDWIRVLSNAGRVKGVKRVTIGSGIRYDLLMRDPNARKWLQKLIENHISGQLKIAPEHQSSAVLRAMRKSQLFPLEKFVRIYRQINKQLNKKYHLIPYLMSCHPGSGFQEMKATKNQILSIFKFIPEQVQAFIPLPMTLSSVIYYTGIDPLTGERFFVEKDPANRRRQHRILFKK